METTANPVNVTYAEPVIIEGDPSLSADELVHAATRALERIDAEIASQQKVKASAAKRIAVLRSERKTYERIARANTPRKAKS